MSFIFNTTLDEELDRYANAENAIAANLGSNLNNTKKQYNVATNKNEFFKNNEGGGYVKVFEQELTALEDAQMYNQSLLNKGFTPTRDDFYAAGFDDAIINEGGFINVQEKSGITEPLTEEVQQQAYDLGFDVVSPVDKPIFEGSIKEITKGLARGSFANPAKFLSNVLPKPESIEDQKIAENLFELEGSFQYQIFDPKTGEFDPAIKFASSDEINAQIEQLENGQQPYAIDLESLLAIDEQSGAGAKVLGSLSQFVGAYAGLGKFFRFGKSNFMKGFTGGAAADFLAFEGNEGRLSDMIYEVGEAFGVEIPQNVIVDFMQTDPNDPDYVGRFKTALEGGVLGVLAEPILLGLGKTFRAIKDGDITQEQVLPFVKAAKENMQETFANVVKDVGERLNQPGQMPPLGSNFGNFGQNNKRSFYVVAREGGAENENAKEQVLIISQGNKPKIENLATYFEQNHQNIYGRQLDPNNDADFDLVLDAAADEIMFQLDQAVSGKGWYDADVKKTFEILSKTPGLEVLENNETMRVLWSAMAAPTSIGNKVTNNTKAVTAAFLQFLKTGKVPTEPPPAGAVTEGIPAAGWGRKQKAVASGMRVIAHLVETKGLEGFADWWLSPHTLRELTEVRKAAGLSGAPAALGGGKDSIYLGAMVLGDKTGRYSLNINGYQGTTKDVWFTRSFNRHFGNMRNPDGTLAAQPRNLPERKRMEEFTARLVDKLTSEGLSEQDAQAVLWFHEQNLYTDLGVLSRPGSFSETAEKIGNVLRSGVRTGDETQTTAQSTDAELTNFRSISAPKRTVRSQRRSGETTGEASSPYTRGSGEGAEGDGLLVLNPDEQTQRIYSEVGISLPKINETPAAETATQYNTDMTNAMSGHTFGAQVEIKSPEELADARLFRTENGSGFAIKPDGDIVAVFQSGNETGRIGYSMMQAAIAAGGKKLDAFDTFLSGIYETAGFKPVARLPWNDEFAPDNWDKNTFKGFNNGEPDVVFYVYDPSYFGGATDVPKFTDYDDAVAAQNAELSRLNNTNN